MLYVAKSSLPKLAHSKDLQMKSARIKIEVKNVIIIIDIQTTMCQLRCILQLNLINLNDV